MSRESTFRSEWISIGDHRVEISVRDGAPDAELRRVAMAAAWSLDAYLAYEEGGRDSVRLASVWLNNRSTTSYFLRFGALEGDIDVVGAVGYALGTAARVVPGGIILSADVVTLPEPRVRGDSYDQTEYLTLGAIEGRGETIQIEEYS